MSGPTAKVPSKSALFAVTGTTNAGAVEILGASLDSVCKKKAKPDDRIDPCVIGNWKSQEWTLPGPIPDMNAKGGADARLTIRSDGHTTWNFESMQPVTEHDEQIDVTISSYSDGETEGFVKAKNGTWDVTGDFNGVEAWREDKILGRTKLVGGPGLFVAAMDGSYTCSSNLLSYSTTDPVEQATVSVLLERVK